MSRKIHEERLWGRNRKQPIDQAFDRPCQAVYQGVGVYSHDINFPLFGTYVTTPMQNFHPVYMNQWNLSVQRQIGQDWLLTANYAGNSTIHMISSENINPAVYVYNGTNVCTLPTESRSLAPRAARCAPR